MRETRSEHLRSLFFQRMNHNTHSYHTFSSTLRRGDSCGRRFIRNLRSFLLKGSRLYRSCFSVFNKIKTCNKTKTKYFEVGLRTSTCVHMSFSFLSTSTIFLFIKLYRNILYLVSTHVRLFYIQMFQDP